MKIINCSKCGAELVEGKRFCNKCGQATEQTAPSPIESTEPNASPAQSQFSHADTDNLEKRAGIGSNVRSFLFVFLGGIALLIVAVVFFVLVHKQNNEGSLVQSTPAASAMPTATHNESVVAPVQTSPTEIALQTLIDVLAVDNASSSPSNDWASLKQTGLKFSIKGSKHCVDTKVSMFESVSVCYSGTQYGPTRLTISKEGEPGGDEIGLHVSHDTPVEDLHKLLIPTTQVSLIRGACPDDNLMFGTSISSISMTGKKPLFAYSMDGSGASGGFSDELTVALSRDLDNDMGYKCTSSIDNPTITTPAPSSPQSATGTLPLLHLVRGNDNFYTTSCAEVKDAVAKYGYVYEGIIADVYSSQRHDGEPLYRLFDNSSRHFYTVNEPEAAEMMRKGWQLEGTMGFLLKGAGYLENAPRADVEPLYRIRAPSGEQIFTTDADERNQAAKRGWTDEGTMGWVVKNKVDTCRASSSSR